MKRFSEQLHKKASTVSLRAAEKRALRERVVSYMEYHPLPTEMKKKRIFADTAALTEEYRVIRIPFIWVARVAASMAILVFVIVPVVAERAVPGDGLYAIKVRFNEEVRSTLSFTTSQKVAWETERLNRRISEARLLASEGKLTEEVEATVAAAVRTHADEAQRNIELLRDVDADEAMLASIAFETTLEVQSASLRKQSATDDSMVMMMAMASPVDESGDQSDLLSSALEDSIAKNTASNAASSIPAFEKTMAKVEQNTTRIYEFLDSIQGVMTKEQHSEIVRRAEDIDRSIIEVVALHQGDTALGSQALVEVLQRTQRLIVYMNDVALANSLDLESIVPVVLTDAEKQSAILEYRAALDAYISDVDARVAVEPDVAVAEKAADVALTLRAYRDEAAATAEYETVKALATSAEAIMADIAIIFTVPPPEVDVPIDTVPTTTTDVGTTTPGSDSASTSSSTTEVDV